MEKLKEIHSRWRCMRYNVLLFIFKTFFSLSRCTDRKPATPLEEEIKTYHHSCHPSQPMRMVNISGQEVTMSLRVKPRMATTTITSTKELTTRIHSQPA